MINRFNYSNTLISVDISIGGIETEAIQQIASKEVEKFDQVSSFSFKELEGVCVLSLDLPIQVIPELIRAFCQQNLAIYEISSLSS